MKAGDNPFLMRKMKRDAKNEKLPECNLKWVAQQDMLNHRCTRPQGHRANHECNCGATRKSMRGTR